MKSDCSGKKWHLEPKSRASDLRIFLHPVFVLLSLEAVLGYVMPLTVTDPKKNGEPRMIWWQVPIRKIEFRLWRPSSKDRNPIRFWLKIGVAQRDWLFPFGQDRSTGRVRGPWRRSWISCYVTLEMPWDFLMERLIAFFRSPKWPSMGCFHDHIYVYTWKETVGYAYCAYKCVYIYVYVYT